MICFNSSIPLFITVMGLILVGCSQIWGGMIVDSVSSIDSTAATTTTSIDATDDANKRRLISHIQMIGVGNLTGMIVSSEEVDIDNDGKFGVNWPSTAVLILAMIVLMAVFHSLGMCLDRS